MPYLEWVKKFIGSANGWEYREGRCVAQVRPDFDKQRWYWSVNWPRQNRPPVKKADGSHTIPDPLPRVTKWGIVDTEEEAKAEATKAIGRGRNG